MAKDIFLYWGSGSPPCWRVMLALEEKGLSGYGQQLLSFGKKEHKTEEILALNPRGQLPVFRHGDIVICESMAILDYLESIFGGQGTKLIPEDPAAKALVLQRTAEVPAALNNIGTDFFQYFMKVKEEDRQADVVAEKKAKFRDELLRWEGYLQQMGPDSYLAGKDFSMADIVFIPQVFFVVRMGLKLENNYPRLTAYYNKVKDRPSVVATMPPHWKEGPGPNLLADL